VSKDLTSIDVVERELRSLQAGIRDSLAVLQQLKEVSEQVADVVTTYNRAKGLVDVLTERVNALEAQHDESRAAVEAAAKRLQESFAALEKDHGDRWLDLQAKVAASQDQVRSANEALRNELEAVKTAHEERLESVKSEVAALAERLDGLLERNAAGIRELNGRVAGLADGLKSASGRSRAAAVTSALALVLVVALLGANAYWLVTGALSLPLGSLL